MAADATPTEAEAYAAFVDGCMRQLHAGLQLDHTQKKQRIAGTLQVHVLNKKKSAAERVLEGRFVLGADDSAYLQTGLATLWSTAPTDASTDGVETGLALSPPGLYTPDAVGGIRAGLVRALKAKTKTLERNAPSDLAALVPALRLLLETPQIRDAIVDDKLSRETLDALLAYKWTDVAKDDQNRVEMRERLLKVLRKLKAHLESSKRGKGGAKEVAGMILRAVAEQARKLNGVSGQLSKTRDELEKRKNEVARQKQTIASLQFALGAVRTLLESTRTEHTKTTSELQACKQALTRARAVETNLRGSLGASRQGARVLRAEKDALDAQVQQLRSELEVVSGELERCDQELVVARKAVGRLEASENTLKANSEAQADQLAENREELKERQKRIAELQKRVANITTKQVVLSTRLQTAERRTKELKVQNEDQAVKLETQKVELGATASGARDAQREAESLGQQLADAKSKVDELERVRDGMSAALAISESKGSRLEQEIGVLQARATQLEAEMAETVEAKRRIFDQLSMAKEDHADLKRELEACEAKAAECEAEAFSLRGALREKDDELEQLRDDLKDSRLSEDSLLAQLDAEEQRRAEIQKAASAGRDWEAWLEQAERTQMVATSRDDNTSARNRPMRNMLVSFILRYGSLSRETFRKRLSIALTGLFVVAMGATFVSRLVEWATESRALVLASATAASDPENLYQMVVAELPALPMPVNEEVAETWYDWASRGARAVYDHVITSQYTTTTVQSINDANRPGQSALPQISDAHGDDVVDFSDWVVARGLVGQRGPTCAAVAPETDAAIAAVDARLEYALPSPEALGAVLPHLKLLLDGTDEPTEAEVRAALATDDDDACRNAATAVETLAAFRGNYAVLGEPVDANDDRGGIEVPHAVRWLPATGAAGRSAARVAMLEHVMARCAQLAQSDATSTPVKAALREAAATLKLAQMAPLYATREAVAYDEPERNGCLTDLATTGKCATLVTRPCAIVRGALAFPIDAGIAHAALDQRATATSVLGDAAEAKAAKERYHQTTLRVRTQARADGRATNVYVAPPAGELKFASAPTGVTLSDDLEVAEDVTPDDFTTANWLRIVNRALVATSALLPQNEAAVERVDGLLNAVSEEGVTAEQRRDGLWTEFRRHSAIAQDRLWVFLRLLSGAVGGDVNEVITMADEATLRQTKAIQDQRVVIAKRVSDMQSKIVETVVGSMAKESTLVLDKDANNQLVVIDGDTRKQLNDLASGESGRPFFESNVAVRNLQNNDANAPKPTLSQLLSSLSQVGGQMQRALEQTLTPTGTASATLAELSHPANSYFVTLRPDAVAAIRIAHERMNVELGLRGAGRRLSLWEVVEGGCPMLTTRFAEFVGHVLVQSRSSIGISAMYVSPQAMQINAVQARVALERLVHAGGAYTYSVSQPSWEALKDKNADLGEARAAIMDAGSRVEDRDVGLIMRQAIRGTPTRSRLSTHRHESGWSIVGLPTR